MPVSLPPQPPPDRPRDGGTPVARFGTIAGLGTAAALACAMPAATRIAPALTGGEPSGQVWVALAAAALLPMGLAVALLVAAREGSRAFGGPRAGPFALGASMWIVTVGVGLAVFGAALRATTHQHALAGVTFALGALALAAAAGFVCARVVELLGAAPAILRWAIGIAIATTLGVAVLLLVLRCAGASTRDPASAAQVGTVVDVLAFLVAAGFAARQARVVRRMMALVGPPAVVVVLAVGVPALRYEPVREIVREKAPAFAMAARLLAPGP